MALKQTQAWVTLERIEPFVQVEPALLILGLALGAWIAFKILLKDIREERKRTLIHQFRNVGYHLLLGIPLFLIYFGLEQLPYDNLALQRIMTYLGLGIILSGAIIFVKVCRILVFEYLSLSHLRVAFPVLLVNLFTLLLSIVITTWLGAEILNIRLAPILATSAIFSLVLGLALQDTLGNLFAGVALQFDKPYEIGDWIEIHSGGEKWVGQVYEISWRATNLISFTHESITVPNRVVAQAEISNFSTKYRPVLRNQIFRIPFGADVKQVKEILSRMALTVPNVRKNPAPFVLIAEITESWVSCKLVYYLDNFGEQFRVADQILMRGLESLEASGFKLAGHRVSLSQELETERLVAPLNSPTA